AVGHLVAWDGKEVELFAVWAQHVDASFHVFGRFEWRGLVFLFPGPAEAAPLVPFFTGPAAALSPLAKEAFFFPGHRFPSGRRANRQSFLAPPRMSLLLSAT